MFLDEVDIETVVGIVSGVTDVGIECVVAVVVSLEDILGECTGDEMAVAADAIHEFLSLVEFIDEQVGRNGVVVGNNFFEDVLDGGGFDKSLNERSVVGLEDDFLWHVAVVDVERALELIVAGDAFGPEDDGGCCAVGDAEDIVGNGKEAFADESCGVFCSSVEVVANAKDCYLIQVEVFPESEVEVVGMKQTALGCEVVKVVDDDECGFEVVDSFEDMVVDPNVTLIERAEVVKAHEHEVAVIGMIGAEGLLDIVDDSAAGVEGVNGVNP